MKKLILIIIFVIIPIMALIWINSMPKEIANNFNSGECYCEFK